MKSVGAVPGGILWLVLLLILPITRDPFTLLAPLLLFAILILVPLILDHLRRDAGSGTALKFARALHPFAASSAALSFLLDTGTWAAIFCGLWMLLSLVLATHAMERILDRRSPFPLEELAMDLGLLYLPVGAAWLVAARMGMTVFGLGGATALLAAVHFHYAGLTTATLVGLAGRRMNQSPFRGLYRLAAPVILAGPVFVAIGITLAPGVEFAAAIGLAVGIALLSAVVMVGIVPTLKSISGRLLISLWGVASTVAMVMTVLYSSARLWDSAYMNVPRMVLLHGLLNAAAALAGLTGWHLLYRDATLSGVRQEPTGPDRIFGAHEQDLF